MTHVWHKERKLYIQNVHPTTYKRNIQNFVFSKVRETNLISLNYRYGPTRCLGVNAAIIDHIRHSPVMGIFTKQKSTCTRIMSVNLLILRAGN